MMFDRFAMLWLLGLPSDGVSYEHRSPTFSLELPSPEWRKIDQSSGESVVLVFSPDPQMATRCTVLVLPGDALPEGLVTREEQIAKAAGRAYTKVAFEDVDAFERRVKRWEYRIAGTTTVEWGFEDAERDVIFQLAAPDATWEDAESRAVLDGVFESFSWQGGDVVVAKVLVDLTEVADVRAMRAKNAEASGKRSIELARHRIEARVEPSAHTIEIEDTITVTGVAESAGSLDLHFSLVEIDAVESPRVKTWSTKKAANSDVLHLDLEPPLLGGESIEVTVRAHCDDFLMETDQQLIAEIGVLGQVRERSSWSSHVVWYPIDPRNDAAVDITFDVPESYAAFTGGRLESDVSGDGRRRMRYVEDIRVPRILPFGFAIGQYLTRETKSESGLVMSVHGFAGEEDRIEQRIAPLEIAARIFERALGPLPWQDVRFVHVSPIRLETGVSLPGMILVSDQYFPDLAGVDLSDGNLGNPKSLGLLVIADELSHQWNIYSAGLPNELGEGISTFTNALFVETLHGEAAYRKTLAGCRRAWIVSAGRETEYAIANPLVYTNTRYRAVVFCKTPIVLDHLRRRLGDEAFFAGFRAGFTNGDSTRDGFDRLAKGFTDVTGVDHAPFFDQWFFRAGFPTIALSHDASEGGVRVTVEQTQAEAAYELDLVLEATLENGEVASRKITVKEKREVVEWAFDSPVTSITIGDADVLPARIEK